MIAVAALGFLYFWRGSLFEKRWLLWLLVFSVLGPQLANQLGWFAAEVGRQPWIVYGLLRTSEGLSAVVKAEAVLASLILFTVDLPAAVRRLRLSAQRQDPARPRRRGPDADAGNWRCPSA